MPGKKYIVNLSPEERQQLERLTKTGKAAAYQITHARILLKADTHQEDRGWTDQTISQALDVSISTIERVRQRFVEQSLEQALGRKPQQRRKARRLDGEQEAQLVALACGEPPAGKGQVEFETVGRAHGELGVCGKHLLRNRATDPQKNELKPWLKKSWVIPPQASAKFVAHMEDVLDLYKQPYDPLYPQVCFDECSKQLVAETRQPLPVEPGQPVRYDYESDFSC